MSKINIIPSVPQRTNDNYFAALQRRTPQLAAAIIFILFLSTLLHLPPTFPVLPFHQTPSESPDIQKPSSPHGPNITTTVAAIIEHRPLTHLAPLLLHFSSVLGPAWPILLFTTSAVPISAPLRRALDNGRISIIYLNENENHSKDDLMTSPWIWEQLAPAEHVLWFSADSMLCSASARKVEDFKEYDFIGAPARGKRVKGSVNRNTRFDGGLSLRTREMSFEITKRNKFSEEKNFGFEDEAMWFQRQMKALPARNDGRPAAKMPGERTAKAFAVGEMWAEYPLGFSGVEGWQAERVGEVDRWCPEWRMARGEELISYVL